MAKLFSLRDGERSREESGCWSFQAAGAVPDIGVPSDDAVVIQKGKKQGEPFVITINCPDKAGLGCDICWIILDFGLYIVKGGQSLFSIFYCGFCDLILDYIS